MVMLRVTAWQDWSTRDSTREPVDTMEAREDTVMLYLGGQHEEGMVSMAYKPFKTFRTDLLL